jgi:hypothetical protein
MVFPYGLHNTAQVIECHVAWLSSLPPASDEFVGMADFFMELIHDPLASDSESISGFASSEGSHHPSRECFMVETSEGHISSASHSNKTPKKPRVHGCRRGEGSAASGSGLSPTTARTTAPQAIAGIAA